MPIDLQKKLSPTSQIISIPYKLFEVLKLIFDSVDLKFELVRIKTGYVKLKQLCRNTRVGDFYFLKIYRIYEICRKQGIEVKFKRYKVK